MEYRNIESILAELHGVTPDKRGAFRSRLRFLRDMGIPRLEKPGKGSRVTYKFLDLWEMHLALLLDRFGLPPAKVKSVLEERVAWLGWYEKMLEVKKQADDADVWVHMRYFAKNIEDGAPAPVTRIAPLDKIVHAIERLDAEEQTAVIGLINLSKLTRECESAILKHVR